MSSKKFQKKASLLRLDQLFLGGKRLAQVMQEFAF